jgi:hypothetical protein
VTRTVVPAEGAVLQRILETTDPIASHGLGRRAAATFDAALGRTAWACAHRQRVALVDGAHVLASAQRYDLTGTLAEQQVHICGIGEVFAGPVQGGLTHVRELIERMLDEARTAGADIALVSVMPHQRAFLPDGFEMMPTMDVELQVLEDSRRGAPMTLVRGGEDRDLAAIVDMGAARARPCRFHLDRDLDLVKYAITRTRLLAGLGTAGARQLQFVIAEEGITAAAYLVISIVGGAWTIEECGDRDPSGARVGAILQALIAQEPAERRPVIRGWLPPRFAPPQVTVRVVGPSEETIMIGALSSRIEAPRLSADDVLYWRNDVF